MARHFTHFPLAFLIVSGAFAQPAIYSTEVENSASYQPQGQPASGIAQGSYFSIFGTGLGPGTYTSALSLPLQTALSGTSVAVTVGGRTVNAYILFAYSSQVNALLPSNTPTGNGTVTVTFGTQTSQPEPVQIVSGSFAPYHFSSVYMGQAIATDLNYQQNSIIHTFHPGDWVVLWGTGLGPISGDDSNLPPVGNIGNPTLHVGNASLSPYYAGRSADFPGLDQVVFQVPSGINGCSVPVAVEINGSVGGAGTIAVSTSGQTCSDSVMGSDLIGKLASGGTVDFGFIQMYGIFQRGGGAPDFAEATFSEFTQQTAGLANYGVSAGYCIPFVNSADFSPAQLNAGPGIAMQGPSSAMLPQSYPQYEPGYYYSMFDTSNQFYWSGEAYTVSGTGGTQVGAFSANDLTSIPSAYFSGILTNQTLSLSGDLTVKWTGGDPKLQNGQVTIAGYSVNGKISGAFLCVAPAGVQSFTIPKWVLSTIPPTGSSYLGIETFPDGGVWIGQSNNPVTFQATGLDKGILVDEFFNGFPVYFK